MDICIAGPGAIGLFLASSLHAKNHVCLIHHNKAKGEALAKTGFIVRENYKTTQYLLPVSHLTPPVCDLLIVAFKSYSFELCDNSFSNCKPNAVLSIQNGLGNCEKLERLFPSADIYAGCTTYGVSRENPNSIEIKGHGEIRIGAFGKGKNSEEIASILQQSGINANPYENIKLQLWKKVGVNACINPIATILNCENGTLLNNDEAQKIWVQIADEIVSCAKLDGISISKEEILISARHTAEITSQNICSMLQDLRAGRKTEIRSICGEISKRLAESGISAPICDKLLNQIEILSGR